MPQAGYTPIQVYYSTSPSAEPDPADLFDGELALNIADKKLFAKDSGGNVFVLASSEGFPGGTAGAILYNSAPDTTTYLTLGTQNYVLVAGATAPQYTNLLQSIGVTPRVTALADATSITFNVDTTDMATQANTQAVGTLTINAPTGTPVNGQKILFRLRSTNVQTFSWNAVFKGSSDLALPATSTGSSKYDYVGFVYNTTSATWQMVGKVFGF